MSLPRQTSRRGDATILTFQQHGMTGRVEVYRHDDGGVTLMRFDHKGDEVARIALMGEDWETVRNFAEGSDGP